MRALVWIFSLVTLLCAGPALAQSDDRGVLQAFIEDNLSDVGREVQIEGFRGALSSRAELDRLTVADDSGVWLTIEGAVLDWNRAAVLRGAIDIRELSAERIILERAPIATETAAPPTPEATPLSVPELPVSIDIDALNVDRFELGSDFLGTRVALKFQGAAELAGGQTRLTMDATRMDGPEGRFDLNAVFKNNPSVLSIDLVLEEEQGGLASSLLGLPENPSVELVLKGTGPLNDFSAQLSLATDGAERLDGSVRVASNASDDADSLPSTTFEANVTGDLRPLVVADYRSFLGPVTRLNVIAERAPDGALDISDLVLSSDALKLDGQVTVAADGWPEFITIVGTVRPPVGDSVTLPFGDPTLRITAGHFDLGYDASRDETWTLTSTVQGLAQPNLQIQALSLRGDGNISRVTERVSGQINMAVLGLEIEDTALADAVGNDVTAELAFNWQPDAPLALRGLRLRGTGYEADGDIDISGVDGAVDLLIGGDIQLDAEDLSRFSGLAQLDLKGAASLNIVGDFAPISGAFAARIDGMTQNLGTGIAQLDPLLRGSADLDLVAERTTAGVELQTLTLKGSDAEVQLAGQIGTTNTNLTLAARVGAVERIVPELQGAVTAAGTLKQVENVLTADLDVTAPGQAVANLQGRVALSNGEPGDGNAQLTVTVGNLSAFRGFAGQPIAGAITANIDATGNATTGAGAMTLSAEGSGLRTGIAQADLALRGATRLNGTISRLGDGTVLFNEIDVQTAELTAAASGQIAETDSRANYRLALRDVGIFVDQIRGPLTASGAFAAGTGPWQIDTTVTAPASTTARIRGTAARDFSRFDLAATGSAALALGNRLIAPNLVDGTAQFDLRVSGPPSIEALSGTIRTSGARLVSPSSPINLDAIETDITISGGSARLDAQAGLSSGGTLRANGTVALSDPYQGDVRVSLRDVGLKDPGFLESSLEGDLRMRGPLAGGARLSGQLGLGPTEIRIPDAASSSGAEIEGLVHLNEPQASRESRLRAGLLDTGNSNAGPAPNYGLDISITAPNQIFVRGRGLDAELGGSLRVTGTTQNLATEGGFALVRGRLDILGQRLTLTEASAQLLGSLDPRLRAVATTQVDDTTINVIVEGTASSPDVSFTSSPSLPEDEILARLLIGRDLSQMSALQALRIANAIRVLSGQAGEGIVGRLRQNFGLDDLDVSTSADNTTAVSAGRYLNENVYTGVTVDSTGKSEINLNLSLSPSVTLRGKADSTGNSGVGIFFERDY